MTFANSCTTSRSFLIGLATLVLLAAALGICVFETGHGAHEHGSHGMFVDLCMGLFLVLPTMLLVARPLLLGTVATEVGPAWAPISIHLPDPPPKFSSAR